MIIFTRRRNTKLLIAISLQLGIRVHFQFMRLFVILCSPFDHPALHIRYTFDHHALHVRYTFDHPALHIIYTLIDAEK